jgi:hypothetical protein
MGKMALGKRDTGGGGCGPLLEGGSEFRDLSGGKGQKETLQEDDGFPEAGIDVVMRGVEDAPFPLGLKGDGILKV